MFSSKKIFEELLATEPKIKHDEASFAMLNMESSIQNTKFEGAAISVTIDYYRSLLLYSNDLVKSPLSSKALDVALKAVDGLLYFYDRIHTTQLPPIDSLISDIKYRCQTSRTCYFPSGWAGSKYGHFAGIKFRVLPDGRYACAIINRGAGMQYHSALKQVGQNKELDYQSHEFAIDLNSSHGQDFLLRVIYLQTDRRAYDQQTIEVATIIKLPSNHNTIKPYSEEDLYGLLEFYGEAISSNKPVLERALPPQVTGTCSITSVEAVVRDALLTLDGITLKDIKLLNFIIRQRSIIEAFKAYRAESSQHAVLEWAVREYYVQISNHAPEILTDEEVIISTQLADHISQILVFDHSQHVNELCARKALPPLEGKWFTKLSDSTPIVIKNEQCITPEKLNIDKRLDSSGCKASDVISYLDQAITYFESETSTMALMELRGFAHSLAITSGAHHDLYWNTLSNEQAVLVVSKLSQIVKFLGNLGSNNHDVTNAPYKFEIALIAYDIAAQLATQIQSLQLNNQYALTLDDVFTHQTFFHDATSYHTTKYISANFKQRESGKQTIFGNSINYHPKDATQDYILNVLLTSEKKQLAIMMLKEKSCLASDEIDVNEKILFKILMTRECNGERKSAFETELVLGETLTNLINLSGTAHSLGIYKSEYSKDGDPDLARPILHFTPTKFHMELTLHDDILRSSDSNAKTKALYELKKHFPPIPRIKDEMLHLDFAENTIYHPHDDLLAKRTLVAKENHNNHLLPYGIKLSGTLRNEESAWETHSNNEQLLEELDEDLRAIGCSPTLQIMNTLEWAQFNIDKLTVEPVRDRLFTLLFEYGRMDTTLANNMNNTVSLIDTFLASAFNTYQFNPDQYLISDNHEAFLWLCRLQHAFRQHLEITSSSYSLKIPQILWPDVKQILTPLLDVKMNRDKRYCLARIIISTYQNLHNLSGNDIQNILTCKLILQINHPKSSGLYSMRFINELDYTVETVWLQHREQINLALSKYTPAKLTATINKVLSQALSKNINNEWRLIGNELQSFDETFVVKLHHGQLIKEKQIVINHEHLLRNSLIYSQLGLREKQLTLFNNGYRTKEGKRTEENTIYLSVISADREWEFYYYPAMNKIYAAFRNVIIAGTSHRFHFLFGNEDSPTPEKYFETHKLSNPLAAFNTKLVYQYWEAVDEESLLFIYDPSQSESAYLYSQDQGWLYLAKQGDTWHYSGQVLLNFNQPRTELEQAWADKLQPMLDLSKIKVEGLLQKNICKIQAITFTALKLSFHTQNNQLECNEYPGYYLSEQRSIEQLNGLPTVIVLENNKGLQKIIVPAFTLKSGHGNLAFERSNITSTQGLSDDANYYLYETDRDGELQGSSIEADLYLSVIYRSQGDYSRAMFYLLRTTHHYNNAQELVQISELLTTRQDQTPLGAAFDCKVACRMLQHTTKWAKKGDTWLHNVVLPSLIKHSLIQYQYYIKTANNHREDINIIPAYLRLSKDDIVCLDQLQDIYKTYLIKKQHIGWQDSYKEISILQQSDFDNHFTTERLEKIQTMPHLENKWRFSIDTIVDDMEFDDARHQAHCKTTNFTASLL